MSTVNPRVVLFSVIFTKIIFDRIYNLAQVINPSADPNSPVLDILEYGHPSSAEEVYRLIGFYGPKGREAYLKLTLFDTGFVLIRLIPLCVFAQWSMGKYPRVANPLIYFHVFTAVWDLIENIMIWFVINQFPRKYNWLASLLCTWIAGKWYLLYITGGTIAIGLLVGIYHSFHSLLADSVLMDKDRTSPKAKKAPGNNSSSTSKKEQ